MRHLSVLLAPLLLGGCTAAAWPSSVDPFLYDAYGRVVVPAAPAQSAQPAQPVQSSGECREYRQSIRIGDQEQPGYGVACRRPDGSWQIVN